MNDYDDLTRAEVNSDDIRFFIEEFCENCKHYDECYNYGNDACFMNGTYFEEIEDDE